jgi:hypothetical protein
MHFIVYLIFQKAFQKLDLLERVTQGVQKKLELQETILLLDVALQLSLIADIRKILQPKRKNEITLIKGIWLLPTKKEFSSRC